MSYTAQVLADSPSAWYRLGEPSGAVLDTMGGTSGSVVGTTTRDVAGALVVDDGAILLNGSTGYVTVPDQAQLDPGDVFTLECWIKRTATGAAIEKLLSKGAGGYFLGINADAIEVAVQGSTIVCTSTTLVNNTSWHHVAWTKNAGTTKIYIDGVDRTGTVTNDTVIATSSALFIGVLSSLTEFYNGVLDEVAIYPTALSAARILAHFNAASDPASTPTWVSPVDTAAMGLNPVLQFTSPTSASAQHFELQLDTANTFNTGNLRDLATNSSLTGWEYFDGSAWQPFPSSGLPANKSGNDVRYSVQPALTMTTWYRRVRAGS